MARALRQVTAVGNSLGVTLPRDILKAYGLARGTLVEVRAIRSGILISPATVISVLPRDGRRAAGGAARPPRPAVTTRPERRRPSASIASLLRELKVGLARLYGVRLKGLYCYGSYARGEQDLESDLDVLVILDRLDHYGAEVDRTGPLVSALSLEYGVSISRVFVSAQDWRSRRSAFLANVRREAVPA
ncbi:MAG: nucleotidyltransferase domain-containing protein [Armatimonadota bacterium]|nr:nucleotidyltransferase domain-containing protein [Armatimonadota bacterium]